jgi:hypothetical protein
LLKRYFAITLAAVVLAVGLSIPTASAQSVSGDQDAAKVRSDVQRLSINRDQKVEVKLKDTTKIKGNITNVSPDSFTVTDPKTARPETLSYAEVAQVKKAGGGLSTKTWLILGGVAAGVVTTWLIVKPAVCDGGAQTRGIC